MESCAWPHEVTECKDVFFLLSKMNDLIRSKFMSGELFKSNAFC